MPKTFFIGNSNNIATLPKHIFFGDSNNIARTVKNIYVGNNLNQAVEVWTHSLVPEEYQQVKYIQNQYNKNGLITTVRPDSNTRVVVDFEFSSIDFHSIYAGDNISAPFFTPHSNASKNYGYGLFLGGSSLSNGRVHFFLRACFGTSADSDNHYDIYEYTTQSTSDFTEEEVMENMGNQILNHRMTVDLNRNNGSLYVDNVLKKTFENTFSEQPGNLSFSISSFLRQPSYSGSGTVVIIRLTTKINFYSCQIYQNDILQHHYVPCYLKSNRMPYYYDVVTKTISVSTYLDGYLPLLGPDI